MPKSSRSRSVSLSTLAAGLPAAVLALAAWGSLAGCKTVELEAPAADSNAVASDTSILRISNLIEQDPGKRTFFLYPPNSVDIVNAARAKVLGAVEYGKTASFTVPAGSWKIAYESEAGDLHPLLEEDSGGEEWVRITFRKDGAYQLILSTDGNRTVWKGDF